MRLMFAAALMSVAVATSASAQSTQVVSVSTGGVLGNANSEVPAISADGRWVALEAPTPGGRTLRYEL